MAGRNYVGKAGHLVAMGEFLLRGYNVAMPEVDVGDDVFVVHDRKGTLWRIQVKTAIGKRRDYGCSGQFAVSWKQVETPKSPDLFYIFVLRDGTRWEFVVISRADLLQECIDHHVGSRSGDNLILTLRFREKEVRCSQRSFRQYRNDWKEWPVISEQPPAPTATRPTCSPGRRVEGRPAVGSAHPLAP